jgi:hypothetical protein
MGFRGFGINIYGAKMVVWFGFSNRQSFCSASFERSTVSTIHEITSCSVFLKIRYISWRRRRDLPNPVVPGPSSFVKSNQLTSKTIVVRTAKIFAVVIDDILVLTISIPTPAIETAWLFDAFPTSRNYLYTGLCRRRITI